MSLKLYILGRPGSGKSAAANFIIKLAEEMNLQSVRINDYGYLYNEFQIEQNQGMVDSKQVRFKKTRNNGFEVKNPVVLDDALDYIANLAVQACADMMNDLVILEFARSDYSTALKRFPSILLRDAHFFFIDTDVPTCIKRVKSRIVNKNKSSDDTYISMKTFKRYYSRDNGLYIPFGFMEEFNLQHKQVRKIHNMGSMKDFKDQIGEFSLVMLEGTSKLRETDPVQNVLPIVSNCQIAK